MSTTLSTAAMVDRLQKRTAIGVGTTDCMYYLNEAFRKINQMSKAGFVWQIYTTTLTAPAGAASNINLPLSFDPGKSAWLRGSAGFTTTDTIIPYKPYQEFYMQEHFSSMGIGQFSAWTYKPAFAGGPYQWVMMLSPGAAFPLPAPVIFNLTYHALSFPAFSNGAAIYFPTPDQFDSFIIDLAEAEVTRIYRASGWEKIQQKAMESVAEMIDTYRTDRYDLSGLTDLTMQAQERQLDKAK